MLFRVGSQTVNMSLYVISASEVLFISLDLQSSDTTFVRISAGAIRRAIFDLFDERPERALCECGSAEVAGQVPR